MAWTTPSSQTTGTLVTAAWVNTYLVDNLVYLKSIADQTDGMFTVVKAADESITASATLQNDDHIFWSVTANKMYGFRGVIYVTTPSTTPEFVCGWTYPSGTTMNWGKDTRDRHGFDGLQLLTETQVEGWTWSGNISSQLMLSGVIKVSSTAGTMQWQWAQSVASGTTTVLKGSFFQYFLLD